MNISLHGAPHRAFFVRRSPIFISDLYLCVAHLYLCAPPRSVTFMYTSQINVLALLLFLLVFQLIQCIVCTLYKPHGVQQGKLTIIYKG